MEQEEDEETPSLSTGPLSSCSMYDYDDPDAATSMIYAPLKDIMKSRKHSRENFADAYAPLDFQPTKTEGSSHLAGDAEETKNQPDEWPQDTRGLGELPDSVWNSHFQALMKEPDSVAKYQKLAFLAHDKYPENPTSPIEIPYFHRTLSTCIRGVWQNYNQRKITTSREENHQALFTWYATYLYSPLISHHFQEVLRVEKNT